MSAVVCGAVLMAAAAGTWLTAAGALAADHAGGSPQACQAYAQAAIEQHKVITGTPAACRGLSPAQLNQAARNAIRATLTRGTKAATRKQAGAASVWVRALISYTPPTAASPPEAGQAGPSPPDRVGGPGTGELGLGVSRLDARLGALLAWLATAASGGVMLVRWLLAGGRPLRGSGTAAPPAVILGHVGAGASGLVLWVSFMLSGWTPLAWTALGLLAPVAGLGMGVLLLGLPAPARPRGGIPVLAIAAHGIFAVTALLLVLMATVGAG
jgi:hypothetical protein